MKLMTKSIAKTIPAIGSTDGLDKKDVKVRLKIFNPCGGQTWFVTEYDPETEEAFGLVDLGFGFPELGYFSIRELQSIEGPLGIGLERDLYFGKTSSVSLHDVTSEGGVQA